MAEPRAASALHHLHRRERASVELGRYPHPDPWKRALDKAIYAVAILSPLMTIPQVLKIWALQSAQGVSLLAWVTYTLCAVVWLFYGIAHREKPIILTNGLFLVLDILIVAGIWRYGTGLL